MATRMKKTTVADVTEDLETTNTVEEVMEEVVEPSKQKKVKRIYGVDDYVLCTSVWPGGLHITGVSGTVYDFKDFGKQCEIAYHDLTSLIRKGSDHIFLPRIVIEDEEFLESFPNVVKVYDELYSDRDLTNILNLPVDQMTKAINSLPEHVKQSMMNLIATGIANGRIDSVRKIRALSEIYDSDFNLISELFGR